MPLTLHLRLVASLLIAGIAAGLFLSMIQSLEAMPLLQSAERMDHQQLQRGMPSQHSHNDETAHNHSEAAHPPQDTHQREAARIISNCLLGVGCCFLLAASIYAHNSRSGAQPSDPATGLVWGLVGYYSFYFAPSLHYPPETPATDLMRVAHDHGSLISDQTGWLCLALFSCLGAALMVYTRGRLKIIGLLVLLLPHAGLWVVSNQLTPPYHTHSLFRLYQVTEQNYRYATGLGNLVFWLLLGGLTTTAINRFSLADNKPPCSV